MTKEWSYLLHLEKDGISPETMPIRELAALLDVWGKLLQPSHEEGPETQSHSDLTISLVSIAPGSISYGLAVNEEIEGQERFRKAAEIINLRSTSPEAYRKARPLQEIAKKMGVVIELIPRGSNEPIVSIKPDEETVPPVPLTGETVIYGRLVKVGGKEPRASLELDNVSKPFPIVVTVPFAQKLASYLYKTIGLKGVASWNPKDWSLLGFIPSGEIIEYEPGNLVQTFRQLADICGPEAWKNIPDVIAAIEELRGDDDEE